MGLARDPRGGSHWHGSLAVVAWVFSWFVGHFSFWFGVGKLIFIFCTFVKWMMWQIMSWCYKRSGLQSNQTTWALLLKTHNIYHPHVPPPQSSSGLMYVPSLISISYNRFLLSYHLGLSFVEPSWSTINFKSQFGPKKYSIFVLFYPNRPRWCFLHHSITTS